MSKDKLKVFYGNSNPELGKKICEFLGIPPGKAYFGRFKDGEIRIKIEENVRGADVFMVQSTQPPAENILELLLFIDAAKRASASRITAVIPYFGYARQDKKDEPRVPISSKVVADLLTTVGASRILTLDLHAEQIQGFFEIPVDHLSSIPVLIEYLKKFDTSNMVVTSPDPGRANRVRAFANKFGNLPIAIVDKRRERPNEAVVANLIGDVKGKDCLIFDDMIDTGGTLLRATQLLKEKGAKNIRAVATHGVFSGDAIEKLDASPLTEIIFTDSLPVANKKVTPKFSLLTVSKLLGEAIKRIHNAESISTLFI